MARRRSASWALLLAGVSVAGALAGCAATAPEADRPGRYGAPPTWGTARPDAREIALVALGTIGTEYRFGGADPRRGFDCSGLVHYAVRQATGTTVPRSAADLAREGAAVAAGELRAGDLVFFDTLRAPFSHVGIYLGDGRFVHAPTSGRTVEIVRLTDAYWRQRFNGARRLFSAAPASAAAGDLSTSAR